jgi:hypothetical protein
LLKSRLAAVRFTLRSRNPVERGVGDTVLSEKEAQLGRMFLDVAQIVELQPYIRNGYIQFQLIDYKPMPR